jgi:putative membrane protein
MDAPGPDHDPRLYMAAERTFLAWIRTGLAAMGFGFVVARFGLFLREMAATGNAPPSPQAGFSLPFGVSLITLGIVVNVVSAFRHRRYVRALDAGRFREAFGSTFATLVATVLAAIGLVMALYLAHV